MRWSSVREICVVRSATFAGILESYHNSTGTNRKAMRQMDKMEDYWHGESVYAGGAE